MNIAESDLDDSILSFSTSTIQLYGSILLKFHSILCTPCIEYDFLVIFIYISILSLIIDFAS